MSIFYANSTASSALNAMALVVLEDIIKKKMRDVSESDQAKICKGIGKQNRPVAAHWIGHLVIYLLYMSCYLL